MRPFSLEFTVVEFTLGAIGSATLLACNCNLRLLTSVTAFSMVKRSFINEENTF